MSTFMDLQLDYAATKRCFAIFGLTSSMLMKIHSDFIALSFLTGVYCIGILGLLSVTPSGLDSIAASIISLRFC